MLLRRLLKIGGEEVELRTVTLIETCTPTGFGTAEDPMRHLYEYWTPDGEKLAEFDSIDECQNADGTWTRRFKNRPVLPPR